MHGVNSTKLSIYRSGRHVSTNLLHQPLPPGNDTKNKNEQNCSTHRLHCVPNPTKCAMLPSFHNISRRTPRIDDPAAPATPTWQGYENMNKLNSSKHRLHCVPNPTKCAMLPSFHNISRRTPRIDDPAAPATPTWQGYENMNKLNSSKHRLHCVPNPTKCAMLPSFHNISRRTPRIDDPAAPATPTWQGYENNNT